jgi:hypothetical protein
VAAAARNAVATIAADHVRIGKASLFSPFGNGVEA